MSAAADAALGPATEALFAAVFSGAATITAKSAARVLGLDPKTLKEMTAAGLIRAVPRGTVPAYTEADLRRFLARGPAWTPKEREPPCQPTLNEAKAVAAGGRAAANILPFSKRRAPGRERLQAR